MIESIHFENFKVLRDCTLPLKQFTLIVGPNGSGKSTALQALQVVGPPLSPDPYDRFTAGTRKQGATLTVVIRGSVGHDAVCYEMHMQGDGTRGATKSGSNNAVAKFVNEVRAAQVFALNSNVIAAPVELRPSIRLTPEGGNLAGVLDRLRDDHPERFEALNSELHRWLPEFDRVLFETPGAGTRAIVLRTSTGHHPIKATDLSQGTLLALAILTLAYLPDPPPIVGFEEPDRGIHPRLLRDVQDALYRLAYPADFGDKRPPVQVIATTHSPYMIDLFKDHLDEIVIAEKLPDNVQFQRLSDLPNVQEILQDSHLGDAWYSGILGGVPANK